MRVNFHTVQSGKVKNLVSPKNISSNQLFSKNVTFTKFLPKICETKSQIRQKFVDLAKFSENCCINKIDFCQKLCLVNYSVWHLVVQIWFKFFQSQNHFSLNWLNLQSNKKSFAYYILQKNFCLFIGLAILEKTENKCIIFQNCCNYNIV